MDGVASARARKAVRDMRRDLAPYRCRGLRCTAELDERATGFFSRI